MTCDRLGLGLQDNNNNISASRKHCQHGLVCTVWMLCRSCRQGLALEALSCFQCTSQLQDKHVKEKVKEEYAMQQVLMRAVMMLCSCCKAGQVLLSCFQSVLQLQHKGSSVSLSADFCEHQKRAMSSSSR